MDVKVVWMHIVWICLQPLDAISKESETKLELGKHRPTEGHIDTLASLPSSLDFWDNYASIRKPVLFKGVAEHFPAFKLWTDDYLKENFGDLKVKLEGKLEKDYYPEGSLGTGQDTLNHFLNTYQKENVYIVSQLPGPMEFDIMVMPFLNCGTFKERILEANLWLSSGGTKSLLHRDADNAINCLLNGTKDWILIDPSFEDLIPVAREDVDGYGGFSLVNPDNIDLNKYPQFEEVPWWYANMTPGDCLYLPYGYWHQVRSYGEKNMAVSVLFSRLEEVNLEECNGQTEDYSTLSSSSMVFRYDGYGDQTMGNADPFELKETLMEQCHEHGYLQSDILQNIFIEAYNEFQDMDVQPSEIDAEYISDTVVQAMAIIDSDDSGVVQCSTLEALSLESLKQLANIVERDPANTEQYEYAKYTPDVIRQMINKLLDVARSRDNTVTSSMFLHKYREIGGSLKVGKEVFAILNPKNKGSITEAEVMENLPTVLEMYEMKMPAEIRAAEEWNNANEDQEFKWQSTVSVLQEHENDNHLPPVKSQHSPVHDDL